MQYMMFMQYIYDAVYDKHSWKNKEFVNWRSWRKRCFNDL